ncbi:TPA: hypothetical protein PMC50_002510 [Vibrio cholerae]|nr:hypothetical protein [Vibrio cholerae]
MGVVSTIVAVVSAVASVVSLAMTLNMRPDTPEDTGSGISRKGQNNPKVVPFGICLVPSVKVFNNVDDNNHSQLVQVHSFGVGKILKFENLFIDGVKAFPNNHTVPNTWYNHGNFNEFPNLALGLRLGEQVEASAFPKIVEHGDGYWTANHRGDRTASASFHIYRRINEKGDNDVRIITDKIKVEALLHGNAVIDPRFDASLVGVKDWTKRTWVNADRESYRNPACVIFTYLLDSYYGLGLPTDAIDVQSFVALANYCDQAKFKFDGYVDQGEDYGAILTKMCSSFDGTIYVEDGVVRAKADKASPVSETITKEHLGATFKLSNGSDSSYHNIVNVEFINTNANYTVDKYVLPSDTTKDKTILSDGYEKAKDIKLPYTSSLSQVKYLANKALKKARYQRSVEFLLDNTQKQVKIYDVVALHQEDYGLNGDLFRVTKIETTLDDKTMVSKVFAVEYNNAVYDSSDFNDGITSPPIKPPTNSLLPPVNLAFEQTGVKKGVLSWNNRHYREHRCVIERKLSSEPLYSKQVSITGDYYLYEDLAVGYHDFRIRVVDVMGATSEWVFLRNQQIQEGAGLPTVTGLKGSFTGVNALMSWDDMKDKKIGYGEGISLSEVFSHYEVVISKGTNPKYAATFKVTDNFFTYAFDEHLKTGLNRDLKIDVVIVDKNNNRSQTAASIKLQNPQVTQPTGVEVNPILSTIVAKWDFPQDEDYQGTEIHVSKLPDFTPSINTLIDTASGAIYTLDGDYKEIHFLRVGHYDKFDAKGIAYSAPLMFKKETIDDLLTESPVWNEGLEGLQGEISGVQGELDKAKQDIVNNAKEISSVSSTVGVQGAAINENKQAISSLDGNLASLDKEVSSEFEGVKSSIKTNQTAISNANQSITNLGNNLSSEINGVKSNLSNNYYTKVNTDGKISTAISASESKLSAEVAGKYATISNLNQVQTSTDGKIEALTQIKHDVNGKVSGLIMGNDGETSTFDVIADKFRVSSKAGDQAVFEVDTTGKTIIRNAMIGKLTADKIQSGVISGVHIDAMSTLKVGAGNAVVKMSGSDTNWRLAVGHDSMPSAPFRVDKTGKMFATNADVTGRVTATSGSFKGHVEAESGSFKGRVEASSGSFKGVVTADSGTLNNVIINENCTIKGKLDADQIVGDVVSSRIVSVNGSLISLGNVSETPYVLYSFKATNNGRKPAIVYVPSISARYEYERDSDTTLFGDMVVFDISLNAVGNYIKTQQIKFSGSGNGLHNWQVAVPSLAYTLAAGQSATFYLTVRTSKYSGNTRRLQVYDTTTLASLFRQGSAFSRCDGELEQEYLESLPTTIPQP